MSDAGCVHRTPPSVAAIDCRLPSTRARTLLTTQLHAGPPDILLLARANMSIDGAPARQEGTELTNSLLKQPGVTSLDSYWTGHRTPKPTATGSSPNAEQPAASDASQLRSADGRTALIAVRLDGDTHQQRITTDRVLPYTTGRHGTLLVQVTGTAVVSRALGEQSEQDLLRTEMLALPATLLLLLIFGSIPAACLPLAVGLVATPGSAALLRALTTVTEVSTFALNVTTAVGLALSTDYSLFLVTRYREDITAGYTHDDALNRCVRTAGRIVVVSAAAVALSLLGLLFFPLCFLRSLAYASISVAILAAAASLLIVPAALACFGPRIGHGDVLAQWRRGTSPQPGAWQRLALAAMRRPVAVTTASVGLLATLILPFQHAAFGFSDERGLPPDTPVAQAARALHTTFPHLGTQIDVVLPGRHRAAESSSPDSTITLDAYARSLSQLPGVQTVRTATGRYLNGANSYSCLPPTRYHPSRRAVRVPAVPALPKSVRRVAVHHDPERHLCALRSRPGAAHPRPARPGASADRRADSRIPRYPNHRLAAHASRPHSGHRSDVSAAPRLHPQPVPAVESALSQPAQPHRYLRRDGPHLPGRALALAGPLRCASAGRTGG